MAQATDGNWYGYFAETTQARTADATTIASQGGYGLDLVNSVPEQQPTYLMMVQHYSQIQMVLQFQLELKAQQLPLVQTEQQH
jgi:hypothetical protein